MCSQKRRFRSRAAALATIDWIRTKGEDRGRRPVRAYRCPACKGWHLASASQWRELVASALGFEWRRN